MFDPLQLLRSQAAELDESLEPIWDMLRPLLPESLTDFEKNLVLKAALGDETWTDDTKDTLLEKVFDGDGIFREKKHRAHHDRIPRGESHWWRMFLAPDKRLELQQRSDGGRLYDKFRRAFRVPWEKFEQLRNLTVEEGWGNWDQDVERTDCCGQPVADLELLLLGVFFHLGQGTTHFVSHLSTGISENTHRVFFESWIEKLMSVKHLFIKMPEDDETLRYVEHEYARVGLVGCAGSIDAVHIGWDGCPVSLVHEYKGKEGYPSIAYLVLCNNRKEIMHVGHGEPGARPDSLTCKNDNLLREFLDRVHFLSLQRWTVEAANGDKTFTGCYLICDGGLLRWPFLMCPVSYGLEGSDLAHWSDMVASTRKDIEDVFGILKRRFHILKSWPTVRKQIIIDRMFTTCCILHNLILQHDGYTEIDLDENPHNVQLAFEVVNGGMHGENLWIRDRDETAIDDVPDGRSLESQWWDRIESLSYHYGRCRELAHRHYHS